MVAPAVVAGAKIAGGYLAAKAKKKIVKYGKKAIKGGIKAGVRALFSQNKGDQGSVNMVKRGLTDRAKPSLASAYNPSGMGASKNAITSAIGGPMYAQRKIMPQSSALSYGNIGMRKTRR